MTKPIECYLFDPSELIEQEPAQLFSRNKKVVYAMACPPGAVYKGRINYNRWKSMELPDSISVNGLSDRVMVRAGFYDYLPTNGISKAMEWNGM